MAIQAAALEVRVTSDVAGALTGLNRVNGAIGGTARFFANAASTALGFITATAGIAGVTSAFQAAGGAAFGLNSQLEQAGIGFETMLGGARPAAQFVEQLAAFARRTPFDFPELLTAAQRLVAMGVAADRVIPFLTATGAAAAALGAGAEGLNRINRALTQMQAKTTVQAEEMRQLAETGIPAWEILADAIGTTVPQAMKLVEKRTVSAQTFIDAFMKTAQQRWVPAFERQATTFQGALSNLRDAARFAAARALEPLFEAVREGALALQAFLATPGFAAFVEQFRAGLGAALAVLRRLPDLVTGTVLPAFARLQDFLGANLPGAVASLGQAWDVLRPAVVAVAAALPGIVDQLGPALTPVLQNLGPILAGAAAAFGVLAGATAIGAVAAAVAGLLTPVGLLTAAVATLSAAWIGDWGGIRTTVLPILEEFGAWLGERLPGFLESTRAAFSTVWTILQELNDSMLGFNDSMAGAGVQTGVFLKTLEPLLGPLRELNALATTLTPLLRLLSPGGAGVQLGQALTPAANETLRQAIATQTPTGAAVFSQAVGGGGGPLQVTFNLGGVNVADPAQVRQFLDRVAQAVAGVVGAAEDAEPTPPAAVPGVLP